MRQREQKALPAEVGCAVDVPRQGCARCRPGTAPAARVAGHGLRGARAGGPGGPGTWVGGSGVWAGGLAQECWISGASGGMQR